MDAVAAHDTGPWWDETRRDTTYVIGVDLGQSQDYTALVVLERFLQPLREIDAKGNQKTAVRYAIPHLERAPLGTSYVAIVERVVTLMRSPELTQWQKKKLPNGDRMPVLVRPSLIVDKTGVGAPVMDLLRAANLSPVGVFIHGGDAVIHDYPDWRVPKRNLISNLQIVFQNRGLEIAKRLPLTATLVAELKNFRAKINIATAHDSYELVMRLGLATPDEKKAAQGYTDPGSGVPEIERPWRLQPVYEPDPRTVFRYHTMLPPVR